MPMYSYRCCECNHEDTEFRHMKDATPVGSHVLCPKCNSPAYQRLIDVPSGAMEKDYHTPIDMYSIAVESIEDIRRMQKNCPDAHISDDPSDPMYGVPIAKNRKAKMQLLNSEGYIETN